MNRPNKLVCLFLAGLAILGLCNILANCAHSLAMNNIKCCECLFTKCLNNYVCYFCEIGIYKT